jgi:hypothetical protein
VLGVVTGGRLGAGEVGEVGAALPVLASVANDAVVHLDLAHRIVPLEVRGIVLRVPEAELDRGEHREIGILVAIVAQAEPPDLERLA